MTSSADYKPPATAADAATGSGTTASSSSSSSSSTMASPQQQQQQHQIHNQLSGAQAPHSPNLPSRIASVMIMGLTGVISRTFLYGFNDIEVKGLDRFKQLLDSREDAERRERGLLTVSNHISVLDDPVVWGVLPLSYAFNPNNLRWTLAAHDICFANRTFSAFFTAGQVLPCHRLKHSPHGGLFQPSLTQAIRLLSSQPFVQPGFTPAPLTSP
ncbi:Lyso-phosphatidylcholine acyltransferase, partial [Neurospora sp. IMI 360204]